MDGYVNKGTCIWCSKSAPEVSFSHKPHIIPKSLGAQKYGCDVCDECNTYFGGNKDLNAEYPNLTIDLAVKEIFTLIRFYMFHEQTGIPDHLFKSRYFQYDRKKSKIIINPSLKFNGIFLRNFINQFKRGLFEIFLQEYHLDTGKGLEQRFDNIRYYSRYNHSPIPVYLIVHDGVYLSGEPTALPEISVNSHNENIIDEYGFYEFLLLGHHFILPVTPTANLRKEHYFKEIALNSVLPVTTNSGIYEITSISSIMTPLEKVFGGKN